MDLSCPCIRSDIDRNEADIPSFVGEDYFCDTGTSRSGVFYDGDPLWDGAGCGGQNTCCSFNDPPWFFKQLPQPTTDEVELRACRNQERSNEDTRIEMNIS